MSNRNDQTNITAALIVYLGLGSIFLGSIAFLFWVIPQYGLYSARLSGEAKLREAESTRQVRVLESKAKADAADLEAKAKVIQAKADAEAFAIIGEQLKNNPSILQYEYIKNLQEKQGDEAGERTVIYVPTQNGIPVLPITEASRLAPVPQK